MNLSTDRACKRDTFVDLLWLIGCAAGVAFLARLLNVGIIDDAYIFLRYAFNIAHGFGPVFNVGERVEGYSSPLWTFLLGLGGYLFGDLERVAQVGCAMAAMGTIFIVWRGTKQTDVWIRRVILLGIATSPMLIYAAGSGMDSALFVWLIAASLASAIGDCETRTLSWRTTALLIVTTLARSEGVLLSAVIGACWVIDRLFSKGSPASELAEVPKSSADTANSTRQRSSCARDRAEIIRSIGFLCVYAAAVFAFVCWRHWYYGSWVPNTAYAKITFEFQQRLLNGATYLLRAIRVGLPLILLILTAAVLARGARGVLRKQLLLLVAWMAVYTAYIVYVGGDNIPALRFVLPVLPAIGLFLGRSWPLIAERLSVMQRRAAVGLCLLAFGLSNACTYAHVERGYREERKLARAWCEVGRWIAQNTSPDSVIATCVPGAMAYQSRRTTIDMLGLTDRTVATQGKIYPKSCHGHSRYHTDYIFDRNPELVVYLTSGRFKEPVCTDPANIDRYSGNALYEFVTDPRCATRYEYEAVAMPDGIFIEMQRRRESYPPLLGSRPYHRDDRVPVHLSFAATCCDSLRN